MSAPPAPGAIASAYFEPESALRTHDAWGLPSVELEGGARLGPPASQAFYREVMRAPGECWVSMPMHKALERASESAPARRWSIAKADAAQAPYDDHHVADLRQRLLRSRTGASRALGPGSVQEERCLPQYRFRQKSSIPADLGAADDARARGAQPAAIRCTSRPAGEPQSRDDQSQLRGRRGELSLVASSPVILRPFGR